MGKRIQVSELLFLLYWGIMLFAKGIGLYDGQITYKVFLILVLLCIVVKMLITKYSYIEWGVIFILIAWSTVAYLVSKEKGILICMITIIAMKNVSVTRAFKVGLCIWTVAFGGSFLFALININHVETAVQTKNITGAVLRYFMGQPHPNVLHISYLVFVAFFIYCIKDTYNIRYLLILSIGNLFVFLYSYSFTGVFIVYLYIVLSYYVSKKRISKIEYLLVELLFPFCILFSVIFPLCLQGKAYEWADKMFNNRINFAKHFLTPDNMSLFGNNLASITTSIIAMDNSYIFALVTYGVPFFLFICFGYLKVVSQYIKQKKNIELAMICCFLIAGITEPFLFNTSFKNLTLLYIGEQLFKILNKKNESQREFSILNNQDMEIEIPFKQLINIVNSIKKTWLLHKKNIVVFSMFGSIVMCALSYILYQPSASVLAIQKENLLFYERIRVLVTFLVIGYLITMFFFIIAYQILDRKQININSDNRNCDI